MKCNVLGVFLRRGRLQLTDFNVTSYLLASEKASLLLSDWKDRLWGSSGSSVSASEGNPKLTEVAGIWKPLTGTTPAIPWSPEVGGAAANKNGVGREFCPKETAESKVFLVSSCSGFDPCFESFSEQTFATCGYSTETRDERIPFELISLRTALRRSLNKSAAALPNSRITLDVLALRSDHN